MGSEREQHFLFPRVEKALYPTDLERPAGTDSMLAKVLQKSSPWTPPAAPPRGLVKSADETADPSKQGVVPGVKEHEFDMRAVSLFQISNIHHSTCVKAKVASTVGIGFENDAIGKTLNPLCDWSFQDVLTRLAEDYWQTGNAYLEVVRDGDEITGLHWVPSYEVKLVVEDALYNRHYIVQGRETVGWTVFAKFGDLPDFKSRKPAAYGFSYDPTDSGVRIGELIHFSQPTSLSRWYGWPDWISAVATIELVQCLKQHEFDFFNNRGVPEFLLFLLGAKLGDGEWSELKQVLKANIGLGNSHKSGVFNITDPTMKVELLKLALDGKTDGLFAELAGILAHEIVSAHGVPPLLANIQIPGKLGATNELPNALVAFQTLKIGPAQTQIQTILDQTLGDPALNGGLKLKAGDFQLKKVTTQIDIAAVDTAARMQDAVASPDGQARLQAVRAGNVQSGSADSEETNQTTVNMGSLKTTKNGALANPHLKKAAEEVADALSEEQAHRVGSFCSEVLKTIMERQGILQQAAAYEGAAENAAAFAKAHGLVVPS